MAQYVTPQKDLDEISDARVLAMIKYFTVREGFFDDAKITEADMKNKFCVTRREYDASITRLRNVDAVTLKQ